MRTLTTAALAIAAGIFWAGTAMAYDYPAGDGIIGTPHDLGTAHDGIDFTANPPDDNLNRVCIFCHAPHNTYRLSPANGGTGVGGGPQAPDAFDYLPLWNHELTGNAESYTTYQNGPGAPTLGPKASQAIQNGMTIGGTSLLCLSCHDGSVAVNSYGNSSQLPQSISGGGALMASPFIIGQDNNLGNHHPIGFNYDDVQAIDQVGIRQADQATMGTAGTVRDHLSGPGNTQMECSTCHSVHNTGNTGETLLWRSDVNSNLCLTCHDKGPDPGATP